MSEISEHFNVDSRAIQRSFLKMLLLILSLSQVTYCNVFLFTLLCNIKPPAQIHVFLGVCHALELPGQDLPMSQDICHIKSIECIMMTVFGECHNELNDNNAYL